MSEHGPQRSSDGRSALRNLAGGAQGYSLIQLSMLTVFPVVGTMLWLFVAFSDGFQPFILIGIPFFALGFFLALRGLRRAFRANQRSMRGADLPSPAGIGTLFVSLACTLVGFLSPFWLMSAMS